MNTHFDRNGQRMPFEEWAKAFENIDDRRIDLTEFPDGDFVSTVWLGINHNFSGIGLPLIFETMSYESGKWVDGDRYSTEEEARKGHKVILKAVEERRAKKTGFERTIDLD